MFQGFVDSNESSVEVFKGCQRWKLDHTRVQKWGRATILCWMSIGNLFLPDCGVTIEHRKETLWLVQRVGWSFEVVVLNRWCLYLVGEFLEDRRAEWREVGEVFEAVTMTEGRWSLSEVASLSYRSLSWRVKVLLVGASRVQLISILLFPPLLSLEMAILHLDR